MNPQETETKGQKGLVRGVAVRPSHGSPTGQERPSGMMVVRLAQSEPASPTGKVPDTLADLARSSGLDALSRLLDSAGNPPTHRLVRSLPAARLLEMERQGEGSRYSPLHSLTQYWRIDLRGRSQEERKRLAAMLTELPEVDAAYEEPLSTLPLVNPADDDYSALQEYQQLAPTGIDARWMWGQPNGEGAGVGIVDVEGGWRVTHEDLAAKAPTLIHGIQYASWEDHGTAVLGEIVAEDNAVGVVGTAPAINSVRMSSIFHADNTQNVTDALATAVAAMTAGEILLIELQTNYLPVETFDDRLDVIRLATARGIIVVEAAGNGNFDLDAWTTPGGLHRLNRASPDFADSGAIMVGACESTAPHDRWTWSNFGSRIDCFAWGENVTTTGYGDLDDGGGDANRRYTDKFQGTSSASPIIVSAAALLQSRYIATTGTSLSPGQMRALLSNPATGTPQGGGVAGAIGVMPNLAAIVPSLGLLPDVYLRDAVGDTGVIPWTGAISASPDVIVRPSPVADPQVAYGEGSGTEGSSTLGFEVDSTMDNYIYLRVRNRGGTPAADVVGTVYWSEVATLVTPSSWHMIGSVTIPLVPPGDLLTVSPALVWPKAAIPGTGHYCFVATLQHVNDPAPPTPGSLDWTTFQDMVRAQNNVTWRNFNVVNVLPAPPDATREFPFKVVGAEDRPLVFGFEIERRLPADAVLELEGPLALLVRLRGERSWRLERGKPNGAARLLLPAQPRIAMEEIRLPAKARLACALRIRLGKEKMAFGHGVCVRQLVRGDEVGRVAWQFAPKARISDEHAR